MKDMTPELIIFYIFMFILGSVFGSFACCQAWRIHEKPKKLGKRSVCMSCKNKLAWFDNIPIISWLVLRGKCRKCKKKIGISEILSEIGLGLVFVGISVTETTNCLSRDLTCLVSDPCQLLGWLLLLIIFTIYWILLVFDAKWQELPVSLMLVAIILSIAYHVVMFQDFSSIPQVIASVGVLAGIYYLLYVVSNERWVGGGDWILCISIAILLGNPLLALIELFLANTLAAIYSVPSAILKKEKLIPLGPFLIIALAIMFSFAALLDDFLYLATYSF